MEDLKQKRAVAKSQFTRAEKSLRRLIESDDTVEEQISKRLIELSQKWQDIQDVHDEYAKMCDAPISSRVHISRTWSWNMSSDQP